MSRASEVLLPFGGEDRLFRLSIGRLRALQEKCDAGPPELLTRYVTKTWRVDDVREPLLQGLVGAGMAQHEAQRLVELHVDEEPLMQFVPLAQAVVMACLVGAPDGEEPGETAAGAATAKSPSREENSASPDSMASAPPSA